MKKNKAEGNDEIGPEVKKALRNLGHERIIEIANNMDVGATYLLISLVVV